MKEKVTENYLVLYNPGMCGTWLVWLINQHNNFPQYWVTYKNYINDKKETKPLDVSCSGADWYTYQYISKDSNDFQYYATDVSTSQDLEEFFSYTFEENRRIRPMGVRNNKSFIKDCVKIIPSHGCFNDSLRQDKSENNINKELLKNVVDDMQPKKIIVPVFNSSDDTLIKRWVIYTKYHHDVQDYIDELVYWQKNWNEWSDWVLQDNPYGNNVHYVDIEKLTSGDNDEYLKLCEAINETPIDNIQEDITAYRNIILGIAAHYDRIIK